VDDTKEVSNVPIIEKLHCTRCLGSWYPRTPNKPAVCPKCKTRYWDKPRREKKSEGKDETKEIIEDTPGGLTDEPQEIGIVEVQTPDKEVVKDENLVFPPFLCCFAKKRYDKDEDKV